tara:strand:+ start:4689 stop:5429 length:741 start_codon:yes stop_codon:yes gene_type:complete
MRSVFRLPREFQLVDPSEWTSEQGSKVDYIYGREFLRGEIVGGLIKILLPENIRIANTSTHQHCPQNFYKDEVVRALGPINDAYDTHYYILLDGTRNVQEVATCDECQKTLTVKGVGESGSKGEKGDYGIGGKGQKGEQGGTGPSGPKGIKGSVGDDGDKGSTGADGAAGDKGSKGSTGSGGAAGQKGSAGDDGAKGSKGNKGDWLDWNDTQQSIKIGGVTFGPRLIGVCQNGTYKYIYVFASDPQ